MGKVMISLPEKIETMARDEVERLYHGRVGGLSIFFENLIRDYFEKNGTRKAGKR